MTAQQHKHLIADALSLTLPDYDWRLIAAQIQQESSWHYAARSPVGAMGLMQIMPPTWADVERELDLGKLDPNNPADNITVGVHYFTKMLKAWKAPRPHIDRICLALASYNAGLGNLLKAQRAAGGVNDYASIIAALPNITGRYAEETTQYVEKILGYYHHYITKGI